MRRTLATAEPESFVKDLWDELRPARERAWSATGEEKRNGVAELFILSVINAVEMATGDLKSRLWQALHSIIEGGMQTDYPSSHAEFWQAAVRRHFRSAACVFTGQDIVDLETIAEIIRPYIRVDDTFFGAVFSLHHAGASEILLANAVARWGIELSQLAERYLSTIGLRIKYINFSRPWLDRISHLASQKTIEVNVSHKIQQ